ncbi:MAG TPA: PIG-L family deacetylase [Ilumatobacteraceae bacterium]|nr:PIG-L family deacetylase [Ilumatobacteraceae bacterium]
MNASLLFPNHLLAGNAGQIAELGTIVTVWAHPDDETYVAGGLMAVASHLGQSVTCVTATDGDFAATEAERRRVAGVRRSELNIALHLLGVTDSVPFGLPDGGCHEISDDVGVALVADVLDSRHPDTVVTFGRDGLTGHLDHRAVSRWTAEAVRLACPSARLLCPSMTPEMVTADRDINDRFDVYAAGLPTAHTDEELALDLTFGGPWLDLKLAALQAHSSQTAGLIDAIGLDRYRRWVAREPMVAFDRY